MTGTVPVRHIPEEHATTAPAGSLSRKFMSSQNVVIVNFSLAEEEPLIISTEQKILPAGTPIPDSDLKLKDAVVVFIERTNDGYIVSSGDLQEDAFGRSPQEAYCDFLTSLKDRFESLSRRVERLSQEELAVLQRLRDLLTSN
jgi:hypothetical protein